MKERESAAQDRLLVPAYRESLLVMVHHHAATARKDIVSSSPC
jgi:hypothetical protein